MNIKTIDKSIIGWLRVSFIPLARIAIFIVYFYFGILKLFGQSPATPLAAALAAKTIGLQYFHLAYDLLAIYECLIGVLFLFPKATRIVIPLLFIHLIIVCSPLILVSNLAWVKPFVPTLEGQYIIKNVAIAALAIGIAAHATPLASKAKSKR
jgi:uncharacterized membrane protein YphA (DoxX/SURF4 family)